MSFLCGGCGVRRDDQAPKLSNEYGEFCSEACFDLHLKRRGHKRKMLKSCDVCQTEFETARKSQRFCSKDCRLVENLRRANERAAKYYAELYPDGIKTKVCRWCNEEMQVSAQKSYAGRLYHPDCSVEAQTARYRIKTVKRQKGRQPHRISHEQVLTEYGSDCSICKEPIDLTLPRTHKFGLTIDHLIPLNKGGTDDMTNLRPAHWVCNVRKSDKMPEDLDA